jgi:hypothetical protein
MPISVDSDSDDPAAWAAGCPANFAGEKSRNFELVAQLGGAIFLAWLHEDSRGRCLDYFTAKIVSKAEKG